MILITISFVMRMISYVIMVLFYSVVVSGSGDSLLVHNMSELKTKIIKGLLGSRQRIGFYSQSW